MINPLTSLLVWKLSLSAEVIKKVMHKGRQLSLLGMLTLWVPEPNHLTGKAWADKIVPDQTVRGAVWLGTICLLYRLVSGLLGKFYSRMPPYWNLKWSNQQWPNTITPTGITCANKIVPRSSLIRDYLFALLASLWFTGHILF